MQLLSKNAHVVPILPTVVLASLTLAPLGAQAGDGKSTPPAQEPDSGALFDSLGVTLTQAYDSSYLYRGWYYGDHLVNTRADLSIPINDLLSISLGAWYASSADNSFVVNETDVYGALNLKLGEVTLAVGYTRYFYTGQDGYGDIDEPFVAVAYSIGGLNLSAGAYYDFKTDGSYYELGGNYPVQLTDWLSLVPALSFGLGSDYYGVSGANHLQPKLSAPIKLTDSATLAPYISYSVPLGDLEDLSDEYFFGGVALAVTF